MRIEIICTVLYSFEDDPCDDVCVVVLLVLPEGQMMARQLSRDMEVSSNVKEFYIKYYWV